jgi:hypothetical protein
MKKALFKLTAIAAMCTLAACQQELNIVGNELADAPVVFTATIESGSTKTALSESAGNYDVLWRSGDAITVVDEADTPNVGVYTTESVADRGDFSLRSGSVATTPSYKAWYPAEIYNNGTPTLPAVQTYVEGGSAADGNICRAPMYAVSGTSSLAFMNICGIVRLNLSTSLDGIKVRRIILSANEGMSGAISNYAMLDVIDHKAEVSGSAGVTLDCGEGGIPINGTARAFHIAVPANTFTSLKITVVTTDGKVQTKTAGVDIIVERSKIATITAAFNDLTAIGNLVHHWPFDGNTNDVTGAVNATNSGAELTADRFGNAGNAYYFNGSSQMSIAQAGSFDSSSSFTFNVWVSTTQYAGSTGRNLIRTDGGTGSNGWFVRFVGNGQIEIWESGYSAASAAGNNYNDGNWHMVTYVRDVSALKGKLYVDGIEVCSYNMSGGAGYVLNSNTHYLGSYGGGEFYEGKMDDVRLYNKALSGDEIAALYSYSNINTFDLSALETANTYIVPAAGRYKFKATVKGNGGFDPLTGTTATEINPADISGVTVLWELYKNYGRVIKYSGGYNISYSAGYVTFSTPDTYQHGAACVAIFKDGTSGTTGVYDKEYDEILWSWLLWMRDDIGTMTHNGKTFMNSNLGACPTIGTNYVRGFLYQWGRKDAFSAAAGDISSVYWFAPEAKDVFTGVSTVESVAYTIAHPTTRIACWTSAIHSWMPEAEFNTSPWRVEVKTIYDPCPPGWKVPKKEDMDGITGLPDTGLYSSDNPALRNFGNADTGYYWTSTISDDSTLPANAYAFCNDGRNLKNWSQAEGYAIRPVRE